MVSLWFIYQRSIANQPQHAPCFPDFKIEEAAVVSTSNLYFPPATFSEIEGGEEVRSRYSKFLLSMQEPSFLDVPDCVDESYRFLWIRTFHKPISIRIWKSGTQFFLTVKELDGKGGYDIGELKFKTTRPVSEDEWDTFISLLNQASFWTLPTLEKSPSIYDGARWVLEGYKKKQYHIVDRHSPDENAYRGVCMYLLKMSGLKIDASRHEIY
jgi:hypothetical protein